MYLYKIRWHNENGTWITSEGLVAGGSMAEACDNIEEYYGKGTTSDMRLTPLESGDGILDFKKFSGRITYRTFFPEE